jgi:peptidoglycan-associated lipoprotein
MLAAALLSTMASCRRPVDQVWDDAKTCSRHFSRGLRSLRGQPVDSRLVCSKDEFMGWQNDPRNPTSMHECEFMAFGDGDECKEVAMIDLPERQPQETPGEYGSSLPTIEAFRSPSQIAGLDVLFRNIHFEYNSNLIKGQVNIDGIANIAQYMRSHPNTYIFIEGHCDERGPEAYNLALGSRRSNSVRTMLIDRGVDGDHVFTISYGKERPLVYGSNEQAWAQNRRAEFKIYQR